MELVFITTNKHKVQEVQEILKPYDIVVVQHAANYEENHDASIEEIAKQAAKKLAEEVGKPVCVDDTGLFFEAYPGFPGALPKFVYQTLGYKGILKLLDSEKKCAEFKCAVGFCEPGSEPLVFEGFMPGIITEKVFDEDNEAMPYDRIFIPDGETKTISSLPIETKNQLSHRGKAFRKLGKYLIGRSQ